MTITTDGGVTVPAYTHTADLAVLQPALEWLVGDIVFDQDVPRLDFHRLRHAVNEEECAERNAHSDSRREIDEDRQEEGGKQHGGVAP
mgnify:CR=1 FL=1